MLLTLLARADEVVEQAWALQIGINQRLEDGQRMSALLEYSDVNLFRYCQTDLDAEVSDRAFDLHIPSGCPPADGSRSCSSQ